MAIEINVVPTDLGTAVRVVATRSYSESGCESTDELFPIHDGKVSAPNALADLLADLTKHGAKHRTALLPTEAQPPTHDPNLDADSAGYDL